MYGVNGGYSNDSGENCEVRCRFFIHAKLPASFHPLAAYNMNQHYIGLMSGTRLDGIYAALVWFDRQENGDRPVIVAVRYQPYTATLRERLRAVCFTDTINLVEYGQLDCLMGQLFAETANDLIEAAGIDRQHIRAIGSHGQTVYHHPHGQHPFTLQIGDPNRIAEHTGLTTVADFRRRDMAAGGQGAPLTPAFHEAVFGSLLENRVVVNIGGIANLTCLSAGSDSGSAGFDSGPGNTLLDAWARQHLGQAYDPGGEWGDSGQVVESLVSQLLADPYFARPIPRSTGQEYFSMGWLQNHLTGHHLPAVDVQASLLELTVRSISEAIHRFQPDTREVLLCGGGVHNRALVRRIRERMPCPVVTTACYGVGPDWVEAVAFAWLARQTLAGLPGNLPSVTGACHPVVLGSIHAPGTPFRH